MNWHDERTGCQIAHRYDAGELPEGRRRYGNCWAYSNGRCQMDSSAGRVVPAFFTEPEDGPNWALRQWVCSRRGDGTALTTPAFSAPEIIR